MTPAAALAHRTADWTGGIFAMIDGARFDDARAMLQGLGLEAQSLFLEAPGRPAPVSGPFFAPLDRAELHRLMEVPSIEGACVLWNGPVEAMLAYRHLRGLNGVRIPRADGEPAAYETELVLFRHWDPAVLALMFPLLRLAQRARMFGPMMRAAFYSADAGEVLQTSAPRGTPPEPREPLELSPAQIEALTAAMRARSHRTIARYLRRNAKPHTEPMDDDALLAFVASAETQAQGWGVQTEAGHGRFAWLLLVTDGRLPRMPEAQAYVTEAGASPDHRLRQLMQAMSYNLALKG